MVEHSFGEDGNMLVDGQGRRAVGGWKGNFFVELGCTLAVVEHRCKPLSTEKKRYLCERLCF